AKPALEPKPRQRTRAANEPGYDARGLVYRVCGVDLTAIEGIDQTTALVLIAEIGPDLSRFPGAKHFCAWLGLCPQHRCSGGKVLSRRGGARRGGAGGGGWGGRGGAPPHPTPPGGGRPPAA